MKTNRTYTSLEICAGAGGQALGLEQAGFKHIALVELEMDYCKVLMQNRPEWNVLCGDVRKFSGAPFFGEVDLLAGGVPCPPFSVAGKQLGEADERDLFPEMLRLVGEIGPKAVMIENVRGFLDPKFELYRKSILRQLEKLGYHTPHIALLNASDFGVSQLRPRAVIVAIRNDIADTFEFPKPDINPAPSVGAVLYDLMAAEGWPGAEEWCRNANKIAPTLVGGSKKHGGPDLGPTRARKAWAELGINGVSIADSAPGPEYDASPRLTPRMMARLQGFPDDWYIGKKKTLSCRMIGNAFPPPVAKRVGIEIIKVLENGSIDITSKKRVPQKAVGRGNIDYRQVGNPQ